MRLPAENDCVWIRLDRLRVFMERVFVALGVPAADAAVCADVLIMADRFGIDTHGINRLKPMYVDPIRRGVQDPVTRLEVVRETATTAVFDGHNGMGQVIARRAMALAIEKAQRHGLGMTAVRNSNHYGIAGYYARMATDAGLIGITGTNARPAVAPTFGVEAMLGTNPLCFGMPSDEPFPFVLDCATSMVQRGAVEIHARRGTPVPPGWVIDAEGRSGAADAQGVLSDLVAGRAALLPLGGAGKEGGGHKGYGYATVVEILSAALQTGSFLHQLAAVEDGRPVPRRNGHFFLAVSVEAFTDGVSLRRTVGDILRQLRASRRAPGCERIYTAGEEEHEAAVERERTGVPLSPSLQREVLALAADLGLPDAEVPFSPRPRPASAG